MRPSRSERFRVIYEANHHRILGYALRRMASAEDARDRATIGVSLGGKPKGRG